MPQLVSSSRDTVRGRLGPRFGRLRFVSSLVLLWCVMVSQDATAQNVPCQNDLARRDVLLAANRPLTPGEIGQNSVLVSKLKTLRLSPDVISRCLRDGEAIRNHVVDFDEFARLWVENNNVNNHANTILHIEHSILWSFQKGVIDFTALTDGSSGGEIDAVVELSEVILGPVVSGGRLEFQRKVNFTGSHLPERVDFRETSFLAEARFVGTRFGNDAQKDGVRTTSANCDRCVRFDRVNFGGPASFTRAVFAEGASFRETLFQGHAGFEEATFYGDVFFLNASLSRLDFARTRFFGQAVFEAVAFRDLTVFESAVFEERAIFRKASFHELVSFYRTEFKRDAVFSGARFGSYVEFENTMFGGSTAFLNAEVRKTLNFRRAIFEMDAGFRDLEAPVGTVNFLGVKWEGHVDFVGAQIGSLYVGDDVQRPVVKGFFDARNARFGKLTIRSAYFIDRVDFRDAEFGKDGEVTLFDHVIFHKETDFRDATFFNATFFVKNGFRDTWDLTGAKFAASDSSGDSAARLCLSGNVLSKLVADARLVGYRPSWGDYLLRWPSLDDSRFGGVTYQGNEPVCAGGEGWAREEERGDALKGVYMRLASGFREVNNVAGENEAWYLSQVAGDRGGWMSWILFDVPSRYGIDPYRAVVVSIVLVLLFAGIYVWCFAEELKKTRNRPGWRRRRLKMAQVWDRPRTVRFVPFEPMLETSSYPRDRTLRIVKDSCLLSARAFFKVSMGTRYPATRLQRCVVYCEWVVGAYILIHFLIAVKNTLPVALWFWLNPG